MALKELRKAGKGWIAGMFLIILVSSFAVWGISDIFAPRGGRWVALVGGDSISAGDFQVRLRFAANSVSRQLGKPLTLEQAQQMGLPSQVLEQMINEHLVDRIASKMGLAVHDDTLKRVIRTTPAFQNASGQFDQQVYKGLLAQNNLSPAGYENELRFDILRAQLREAVMGGAQMPRGLLSQLLAFRSEMRAVNYVALDPAIVGEIPPPSKAALETLIDADKNVYSTPELRTFVAIVIKPDDLLAQVTLTDAELEETYKYRIAEYTTPEQRSVRVIAFPDEAAAGQAMAALQNGAKTFEDVAHPGSAYKLQSRSDISDPEVARAVFEAKKPGLIGPINGALAWAIADLKETIPEHTRPFAEVKEEIRAALAKVRVEDLIDDTVDKFEDMRAGGSSFEEIATALKLPLLKFDRVDAEGRDRTGKEIVTSEEEKELLKSAFLAEVGLDSDPAPRTEGGEFVVRLDALDPPALKPFAEIEAAARAAYDANERKARLTARAEALVKAHAKAGLNAVAAELNARVTTLEAPLRRVDENTTLSPTLIDDLFAAKPGALVIGDAQGGRMVIATVTQVDRATAPELAQGVQSVQHQLDETMEGDVTQAFLGAARSRYRVRIDQAVLDQAISSARL